MRMINYVAAVVLGASVFGCSKDGAVLDFVKENDTLVAEIKKSADPDAARKVFDGKKDALKSKLEPLKNARGFQLKEESLTALTKSLQEGVTSICSLQISAMGDEAKSTKYKSLCDDYTSVMSM